MKKTCLAIIFLFCICLIFAQEEKRIPVIAIPAPYMSNDNTFTEFFNKQFAFEFFSSDSNLYEFEIIHTDYDDYTLVTMQQYFEECKQTSYSKNYDYMLFSKVYTLDASVYNDDLSSKKYIIFKYDLIDLNTDKITKSGIYNLDDGYTLNEVLSYISKKIIFDLNNTPLEITEQDIKKIQNEKADEKKEEEPREVQQYEENQKPKKHEIYVQNGFLKTTPKMMSFLSLCIGYNFIPYKFFDLGGSFFFGGGSSEDKFDFSKLSFDRFYLGTSTGLNFFLPGFAVEPSVGFKVELAYLIKGDLDLYIPIDMGFKFNLHKHNYLKINFDFQFTTFNILQNRWQNNYLIGIWIGYGKKI